jgi:hypothetical protein
MKHIILMTLLLVSNVFAESRVEKVAVEDITVRLNSIQDIQLKLKIAHKDLDVFEKSLIAAAKTEKREKVFVIIRNTAAIAAAVSFTITGSLFYKVGAGASEGGLYQLLAAYGGAAITGGVAVVAVGAEVGVYFSQNEAKSLREAIGHLKQTLITKQNELKNEVNLLCKEDPRHKLCY